MDVISTDGKTRPTTASKRYTVPIPITGPTTVLAMALAPGRTQSAVTRAVYGLLKPQTITFPQPAR